MDAEQSDTRGETGRPAFSPLPAVMLLAGWLGLTATPALARDSNLTICVDHPSIVSWSPHGANDFRAANEAPALQVTFTVDDRGSYDVKSVGTADFFHRWVAERNDFISTGLPVTLVSQPVLDGMHVGLVLALGLVCLAGTIRYGYQQQQRRLQASVEQQQRLVNQLSEAQARAGLFPLNGALPEQVGSYRVKGRLGTGGMAVVYQVESPAGDQLALKLPLPQVWDDPEFKLRFGRELKIASSLRHPHLVRIVDLNDGSGDFPYPFLVMEWIRGKPLSACLHPDVQQPINNVVTVGLQALAALHHAHQHKVIHRDIKPSNIMITEDGQVRVMDFGVARTTDGTRLTGTEEMLGTPLYMAPEQVESLPVDARTDIYALGVVLYEMTTGTPPFTDPNYLKLTMMKLRDDPPRLGLLRPEVDERLEACIMKMIARRPESRYWTADEAMAALQLLGCSGHTFVETDQVPNLGTAPTLQIPSA